MPPNSNSSPTRASTKAAISTRCCAIPRWRATSMTTEPGLGDPMGEGGVRLEPLAEGHRAALRAACAEDREIWTIYAISYDPEHFDASFDALLARPNGRAFAIFSGGT